MAQAPYEFTVVGCGPGSREYLTPRATACVARAELIAGSPRLLDLFSEYPAHKLPYSGKTESWLDRLEAIPARPCVVLVSGDPGISSLSRMLVRRFGPRRCRVEPGISSVQLACASLGLSWQNAEVIDCHSDTSKTTNCPVEQRDPWVFLMGATGGESSVSKLLRQSSRFAYVAENLSLPEERIARISADELDGLSIHPRRLLILTKEPLLDE